MTTRPPAPTPTGTAIDARAGALGGASGVRLPSPWIARFDGEAGFAAAMTAAQGLLATVGGIDDQIVACRHPRDYTAYCQSCATFTTMRIDWRHAGTTPDGSVHPAWTETSVCTACGLNSRMRALLGFVLAHGDYRRDARCYLAERVTPSYPAFGRHFEHLTGSEYLGRDRRPGERVHLPAFDAEVRHEDLTGLSFADASFEWVVTQDVFEHVPDYPAAFAECARVLVAGGHLVFTVPFNSGLSRTQVRALVHPDGRIEHRLPPEVHGNPVEGGGALCFQNFGWDLVDTLRGVGFTDVAAHAYWGPWLGHVGFGGLVFSARKKPPGRAVG